MNKFIQTIRDKWVQYILEIIVIISSILGAFALENWNDDRKTKQEEQNLIKQLIIDYTANLEQLEQKIALHQKILETGFSLLDDFDNPSNVNLDTLYRDLAVLGIDPTYDPIINNLESSGKINLIHNLELNRLLTNWSSDIIALQELEEAWTNISYGYYLGHLLEIGVQRNIAGALWNNPQINSGWLLDKKETQKRIITKSKREIEPKLILEDVFLEGVIAQGTLAQQVAIEQALPLKVRVERILELLNKSLDK